MTGGHPRRPGSPGVRSASRAADQMGGRRTAGEPGPDTARGGRPQRRPAHVRSKPADQPPEQGRQRHSLRLPLPGVPGRRSGRLGPGWCAPRLRAGVSGPGIPRDEFDERYRQDSLAQARARMGDEQLERACAQGMALSLEKAFDLATAAAEPGPGAAPAVTVPAPGQATADGSPARCRNESGRSWRCSLGGDRRPDRRAAVRIGEHGQIASGADPGQDRRPPASRTDPLRHPGWHRPGRPPCLRAGPCLA